MPQGSAFFDSIVRQPPIDEDRLDPEENLEEFGPDFRGGPRLSGVSVAAPIATGCAVVASFGGTGFGDIALVPAPSLKYPKGIRDIAEWYVSTSSRRDYVHRVFERQCEVGIENLARIHAASATRSDAVHLRHRFRNADLRLLLRRDVPRTVAPVLPASQRLGPRQHAWRTFKHSCGSVVALLGELHRGWLRHHQPRAMLGGRNGPAST